jgi:hypothetical protein
MQAGERTLARVKMSCGSAAVHLNSGQRGRSDELRRRDRAIHRYPWVGCRRVRADRRRETPEIVGAAPFDAGIVAPIVGDGADDDPGIAQLVASDRPASGNAGDPRGGADGHWDRRADPRGRREGRPRSCEDRRVRPCCRRERPDGRGSAAAFEKSGRRGVGSGGASIGARAADERSSETITEPRPSVDELVLTMPANGRRTSSRVGRTLSRIGRTWSRVDRTSSRTGPTRGSARRTRGGARLPRHFGGRRDIGMSDRRERPADVGSSRSIVESHPCDEESDPSSAESGPSAAGSDRSKAEIGWPNLRSGAAAAAFRRWTRHWDERSSGPDWRSSGSGGRSSGSRGRADLRPSQSRESRATEGLGPTGVASAPMTLGSRVSTIGDAGHARSGQ